MCEKRAFYDNRTLAWLFTCRGDAADNSANDRIIRANGARVLYAGKSRETELVRLCCSSLDRQQNDSSYMP